MSAAYLFDTNSLIYFYQGRSLKVIQWLDSGLPCFISNLTILELRSTLATWVRDREVPFNTASYKVMDKRFSYDISSLGRLRIQRVRRRFVAHCTRLIEEHGLTHKRGLHTLDALQLSAAIDLGSRYPNLVWITADRALAALAPHEGIAAESPL